MKPSPVTLPGAGPFETPIATGCRQVEIVGDHTSERLRLYFQLIDGQELQIPMTSEAMDRLLIQLKPFLPRQP